MVTQQDIQEAYNNASSALHTIHKKRKTARLFKNAIVIVTGLLFMVTLGTSFSYKFNITSSLLKKYINSITENPMMMYVYLLPLFAIMYVTNKYYAAAYIKFKTLEMKTISKMIKSLFPDFEFSQAFQLPLNQIQESKLFSWINARAYMVTHGELKAEVKGQKINIADIGIIGDDIKNKTTNALTRIPYVAILVVLYQTIFKNLFTSKTADNNLYAYRGMYCWTDFNKQLQGSTVLIPNKNISKIERFSSFEFKEEEEIILEDPRFNKHFLVYSKDQVEARYVLSTSVMEKIVQLKEKFGRDIMLSFLNGTMYLTVENPHGLFSFPSGKLDSIKIIEELVEEINTALGIVEEFDLDRKTFANMVS